jgi:drug/metabolite transporter (DMT)-like permease
MLLRRFFPVCASPAVLGVLLMVAAVFLMQLMNAGAKAASAWHAPIEVVFYRGAVSLFLLTLWIVGTRRFDLLKTKRPLSHLGRSLIGNVSVFLVFWSYALLPMAEAASFLLTSGLMATALSVSLLGEKVGKWRWGAVGIGFIGALLVANPAGEEFTLIGTMIALAGAFTSSLIPIFLRSLGKTEHAVTTVFYFVLTGVLVSGVYMVFAGHPPTRETLPILVATGLASLAALLIKTKAYQFAEASLLVPYTYTSLIWATLIGWLAWDDIPGIAVIAGAVLIVGSNLVILWREKNRQKIGAEKIRPLEIISQ